MPYVSSYYRRTPGGGDANTKGTRRRIDLAVYGPDGATLLRDPAGGRYLATNLSFDSVLPGGFGSAAFTLRRPAAERWPGRAGLKVVLRRGTRVLWWGAIEDIQRRQQGRCEQIDVTCLGPWQQVSQRRFSPNYAGTMYGNAAIAQELRAYCDLISTDYSQLAPTGVNIAPLTWSNEQVSRLIQLVCQAGNSSGAPLLFAIWEPSYRSTTSYPAALNTNPDFEIEATGLVMPQAWTSTTALGNPQFTWTTAYYNSLSHGARMSRGSASGTQTGFWRTQSGYEIPVTAGSTYTFDFWLYFGAVASISAYVRVNWYNASLALLSQVAGPVYTGTGAANGTRHIETFTAPTNAAYLKIDLSGSLPDSGANSFIVWDDAYIYPPGTGHDVDRKPRARLWARSLTTADYWLYTRDLAQPLDINETTRELANAVLASYGSGPSYTSYSQDADSQALYRRRDYLLAAGNVSAAVAEAARTAYLGAYAAPRTEPGSWRLSNALALCTAHGARIWPEDLRAGDVVQIADGPAAGTRVLLKQVSYADGVVTATPERPADVPLLLAKVK